MTEIEHEFAKIEKLTGEENWGLWKFQVRVINLTNGAAEILSGDLVKPEPAGQMDAQGTAEYQKRLKEWKKVDGLAQKSIVTTINARNMLHIINCTSAREMWLKLHEVYENKSETSKHMLQQKWFSLVKDATDDIATRVSKIKDLACRLAALGEPVSDSMIMTKILMTLPSSLKHFRTAWESTGEEQRTLTNLISRLSMEEIRQGTDQNDVKNKY
ncbi:uncharacterized protein LOC108627947 [Ceratina calcarata]|uniref:Uncharacterized protein LOC108627947 n=1 Tax=Ceratina calcarata TaxID=156304 RepID=A0AAJ7NA14_9HYME|nr:uncharacterized protein LOC108627947 [Ceratina calcarata]